MTETQVFDILDPYGDIRIFKLVKDPERPDLNRCYVKFTTKEQALLAIKELNGQFGFPGAESPLEFVFADQLRTNTEKPAKEEPIQVPYTDTRDRQRPEPISDAIKKVFYEFKSPEGVPYYFDIQANKTQWEKPTEPNVLVLSEVDYYKSLQGDQPTNETQQDVDDSDVIKILIKNLPNTWEDSDFYSFVNTYGNYDKARLADQEFLDTNAIESAGLKVGVVEIIDPGQAQNLVNNVNGLDIHGNTLELQVL